jgi:hypothetical protein
MTERIEQAFLFQALENRQVVADFQGGNLSGDGGVILLREIDLQTRLTDQLAACFTDFRDQRRLVHSVPELLRQRLFGIAMGYEDLNDHDSLRHDPVMAVGVGKSDPLGLDRDAPNRGKALAGKSTLNRLELTNAKTASCASVPGGVHKIRADHGRIEELLIRTAVSRLPADTREIILDFDTTDSVLHGDQEGRFFHGYYDAYCYLPLYVFIGPWPVWAKQRTSSRDASVDTLAALEKIVPLIRERFPEALIILRADSGFARDSNFSWCEDHEIGYCTYFCEFVYRTATSWSRARRVIGKAQVNPKGENPRFVVTNLPGGDALIGKAQADPKEAENPRFIVAKQPGGQAIQWRPEYLYRDLYCGRGNRENRIKEQQLDLFADRMSCQAMVSNQLRLWLSTFAYVLMIDLRERGLADSEAFREAAPGTIRDRLLKIATMVTVSVRRVVLRWSSSFRYRREIAACCARLGVASG